MAVVVVVVWIFHSFIVRKQYCCQRCECCELCSHVHLLWLFTV